MYPGKKLDCQHVLPKYGHLLVPVLKQLATNHLGIDISIKLSSAPLDCNLPKAHDTEKELVGWIAQKAPCGRGDARVIGRNPEKEMGIQQEIHSPP